MQIISVLLWSHHPAALRNASLSLPDVSKHHRPLLLCTNWHIYVIFHFFLKLLSGIPEKIYSKKKLLDSYLCRFVHSNGAYWMIAISQFNYYVQNQALQEPMDHFGVKKFCLNVKFLSVLPVSIVPPK